VGGKGINMPLLNNESIFKPEPLPLSDIKISKVIHQMLKLHCQRHGLVIGRWVEKAVMAALAKENK
jgi:hypothetical protein